MRIFEIIEIELENIKTYVYEKIKFSQGNNVFIGENGAGKSTILECIFLALFGDTVLGRNLADMIRFGQQQGKITIRFSVDNVIYRIEDAIVIRGDNRTTQTQVLVNQDLGDTIAEGRNAVRTKMEELLDIDATTFISAIYASQGEIGKIITEKDSNRKRLFDRLFQIERYEKSWHNLSKVEKIINNNIVTLENNIMMLRDDLIDLPVNQKQLELKKKLLKQEKKNLSLLKSQSNEIDQKYKAIENLIEKYNKLIAEKNHLVEQQKTISDSIASQFQSIEEKTGDKGFECSLQSVSKIKKISESKIDLISEEIKKLRDEEQSIKLNLEKINNLKQTEHFLDSTINQNEDEIETEIKYFTSRIAGITRNISNWNEKIPDILKNTESKIIKFKTKEKTLETTSKKIIQLKIELKTKEEVVNKNHNRIFQKRLLLAQEAGENWREVIENLSHINFKEEIGKITSKINKLDEKNTDLLKQKSALENSIKRIHGDLQHLNDLQGEETCPTCKQSLSIEMLEELSSTLISEKRENQDEIKDLAKKIQNLVKEIKDAKEHEKELRRKNQVYSTLKPNFDELVILENENNVLEKEVKILEDKYHKANEEFNQEQLDKLKEQIAYEYEKIQDVNAAKRILPKLMKIKEKITTDKKQMNQLIKEIGQLKEKLNDKNLESIKEDILIQENENIKHMQLLDVLNQINRDFQNKKTQQNQLKSTQKELLEIESIEGFKEHNQTEEKRIELGNKISSKEATIKSLNEEVIPPLIDLISKLEKKEKQLKGKEIEVKHEIKKREITSVLRGLMRELPNKLLPNFIERINNTATEILQSIIPGSDIQNIVLNDDYSLNIIRLGNFENITVLSGGETIIIALALRLAFAKEFSALDLLILDEPTIFLDERRRGELVSVLEKNRLVRQMFVVTHDPDFERISDKTYFITKIAGVTSVKTIEDEVIDSSITDLSI